jgi:hypothetical protein
LSLAHVWIYVIASDPGVSVVRVDHSCQHIDECCLACSIWAQKTEGFLVGYS